MSSFLVIKSLQERFPEHSPNFIFTQNTPYIFNILKMVKYSASLS